MSLQVRRNHSQRGPPRRTSHQKVRSSQTAPSGETCGPTRNRGASTARPGLSPPARAGTQVPLGTCQGLRTEEPGKPSGKHLAQKECFALPRESPLEPPLVSDFAVCREKKEGREALYWDKNFTQMRRKRWQERQHPTHGYLQS